MSFYSLAMSNVTIYLVYGVSIRILSKAFITSGDGCCNKLLTSSSEMKKFYRLKRSQ